MFNQGQYAFYITHQHAFIIHEYLKQHIHTVRNEEHRFLNIMTQKYFKAK